MIFEYETWVINIKHWELINMQKIIFTYDTIERRWHKDDSGMIPGRNELHFCFVSNLPRTRFSNLEFSYEIKHNDQLLASEKYPANGVNYEYADAGPLAIAGFEFEPEKKYYVTVRASNEQKERSDTFEIVGVRPPKPPFDSWTWNGEAWVAPVPMPTDGFYEWIESKQFWNKIADFNANFMPNEIRPQPVDGIKP